MKVKCIACGWKGTEHDLELNEHSKTCPNCDAGVSSLEGNNFNTLWEKILKDYPGYEHDVLTDMFMDELHDAASLDEAFDLNR